MTPEQQRIAIAEACELKNLHWIDHCLVYGGEYPDVRSVPDYPKDLNAMHEAEKVLTTEQQFDYVYALNDALGLVPLNSPASFREAVLWLFTHATAAQRAEAMCRTLWPERWEDSQ